MVPIAVLLAKLLDPISLIVAGGTSAFVKKWWYAAIVGVVVAVLVETILVNMQVARRFGEGLPLGVLASEIHAFIGFMIGRYLRTRKNIDQRQF